MGDPIADDTDKDIAAVRAQLNRAAAQARAGKWRRAHRTLGYAMETLQHARVHIFRERVAWKRDSYDDTPEGGTG